MIKDLILKCHKINNMIKIVYLTNVYSDNRDNTILKRYLRIIKIKD
ncbi:hypothetical protein J2127_000062 [Methanococcus voltae]|nr:hypothetical protein [Methanococcus voltae]